MLSEGLEFAEDYHPMAPAAQEVRASQSVSHRQARPTDLEVAAEHENENEDEDNNRTNILTGLYYASSHPHILTIYCWPCPRAEQCQCCEYQLLSHRPCVALYYLFRVPPFSGSQPA